MPHLPRPLHDNDLSVFKVLNAKFRHSGFFILGYSESCYLHCPWLKLNGKIHAFICAYRSEVPLCSSHFRFQNGGGTMTQVAKNEINSWPLVLTTYAIVRYLSNLQFGFPSIEFSPHVPANGYKAYCHGDDWQPFSQPLLRSLLLAP